MEAGLTEVVTVLARAQWPIRIHATYDQSITRFLAVFERVFRATGYRARWAFDHAEGISPANIAKVRAMGGGISVQDRLAYAGEVYAERYGRAQASNAPPLRRILAAGVPMGAGTDGTRVSGYNPVGRAALDERGAERRGQGGALARRSAEPGAVAACFHHRQRLVLGRRARQGAGWRPVSLQTLAVLSDDYFAVSDRDISGITSTLTVTGGRIVHGAGDHAGFSPPLPPVSPSWSPVTAKVERS
jgi:predicted amidohydrolase YtcJ